MAIAKFIVFLPVSKMFFLLFKSGLFTSQCQSCECSQKDSFSKSPGVCDMCFNGHFTGKKNFLALIIAYNKTFILQSVFFLELGALTIDFQMDVNINLSHKSKCDFIEKFIILLIFLIYVTFHKVK